ncbi:hypothetical protein [Streptomyces sp. NPDC052042]
MSKHQQALGHATVMTRAPGHTTGPSAGHAIDRTPRDATKRMTRSA